MTILEGTSTRRATPDDAALIRDLVRAAYARWVPLIGREPMPMRADYDRATREHEIDLCSQGDTLIALIELIPHPDHLYIENLAVAPTHQGQGLGTALLHHAERRARKASLPELRLLTNQAFASNLRLYQSFGFAITRTEPYLGGTTVHMRKPLQNGRSAGAAPAAAPAASRNKQYISE